METYRIAVYPYNQEFEPILNYINLLSPQYRIRSLISPHGWGYVGKTFDFGEKMTVQSSINEIENDVNCIFIPEFESTKQFETSVVENIRAVMPRITKIICGANLKNENLNKLKDLCEQTNGKCTLELKGKTKNEKYCNLNTDEENSIQTIENIQVPIIVIAGIWESVDKFYTSLALRDMFLRNGYKVSQIGSRGYCEMMGFHSFPKFMLNSEIDEAEKVVLLNRYIKQISDNETPDVIIISIPGAIQSLNSKFTKGFGILPYLVFKSFITDFLIMCTFYEKNGTEFFDLVSKSCLYKYDCNVDCFHMSNQFIDFTSTSEKKKIEYRFLPRQKIVENLLENYKESSVPIVNIYDKMGLEKLYEQIVNKLSAENNNVVY